MCARHCVGAADRKGNLLLCPSAKCRALSKQLCKGNSTSIIKFVNGLADHDCAKKEILGLNSPFFQSTAHLAKSRKPNWGLGWGSKGTPFFPPAVRTELVENLVSSHSHQIVDPPAPENCPPPILQFNESHEATNFRPFVLTWLTLWVRFRRFLLTPTFYVTFTGCPLHAARVLCTGAVSHLVFFATDDGQVRALMPIHNKKMSHNL